MTSDDGAVTLPSIDLAEAVVVTGSSAGGMGALQNMDFVHEQLAASNPGVIVKGVLDANLPPSPAALDAYPTFVDAAVDELATPGEPMSAWRLARDAAQWNGGVFEAAQVFLDETCVAAHPLERELCTGTTELLLAPDGPFIETELFVRHDLGDGVVAGPWKACINPLDETPCYDPPHSFLSSTQTAPGAWQTLADFANQMRPTLLEALEIGAVTGVFAPLCGTHTGLTNENFTQQLVEDYDEATQTFSGDARTFRATLGEWLLTGGPLRVIDAAPADAIAPSSQCLGVDG